MVQSTMLKTRKKLKLHFSCARHTEGTCQYNGEAGNTFTTETSVWQKWVKVSFCAFQTGKAAWDKDFGGVVEGLKGLYCAALDDEKADFVAFIRWVLDGMLVAWECCSTQLQGCLAANHS